ncbi:MAG: TonB-dependent receptor domain-containing protein [Bacteroidota bacterium]
MKFILIWVLILISFTYSSAQNNFSATIIDDETKEPLIGATVTIKGTTKGAVSDLNGLVTFSDLASGTYIFEISYVGYENKSITLKLPSTNPLPMVIELTIKESLETIIVSATRSSRSIEDLPTRVEAITSEELDENAAMNSANISMLLKESSGIMVQQTSANSGNQTLRIQGLDGRYTQILKDGFPLYSGFSSGLSIMQVPPLDLQQVEVIKGSASTLYGGGAIAGLINLVSKRPEMGHPELNLMLNQTTAGGTTGNLFYAERYNKTGLTLYGSVNRQEPYDPNSDNFSDIPEVRSYSLNPKFFWYPSENTTLWVGLNTSIEDRTGGDLKVIQGDTSSNHRFFEENLSNRISSQLFTEHQFNEYQKITVKNSINYFDRQIKLPAYTFHGKQLSSYSEVNFSSNSDQTDWIAGLNLFTDNFIDQTESTSANPRSYQYVTKSVFGQNTWNVNNKFSLESGFRLDHNKEFGLFPMPRISALFKANSKFTYRLGGGLGYKLPTIFNEQSETRSFQNVIPINENTIKPERSSGVNFDITYKETLGNILTVQFNQLFFFTNLSNTLVLEETVNNNYAFNNADGPVQSSGFESNLKFGLNDFLLYLQYSFTDVQLQYDNLNRQKPLTPKHQFGGTLMYEVEDKWRVGYELYYVGSQFRSDYSRTTDYWMMGFMALREFEKFSIFINFENFTDTRQSRFQAMFSPPATNPTDTEIWAPTDGFIANAGIMIHFLN